MAVRLRHPSDRRPVAVQQRPLGLRQQGAGRRTVGRIHQHGAVAIDDGDVRAALQRQRPHLHAKPAKADVGGQHRARAAGGRGDRRLDRHRGGEQPGRRRPVPEQVAGDREMAACARQANVRPMRGILHQGRPRRAGAYHPVVGADQRQRADGREAAADRAQQQGAGGRVLRLDRRHRGERHHRVAGAVQDAPDLGGHRARLAQRLVVQLGALGGAQGVLVVDFGAQRRQQGHQHDQDHPAQQSHGLLDLRMASPTGSPLAGVPLGRDAGAVQAGGPIAGTSARGRVAATG